MLANQEATSPPREPQPATANEKPSQEVSAPPRSGKRLFVMALGVALPLIAGTMVWWPWGVGDMFDSGWVLFTVAVAGGVLAFAGALLLRTPWALLIVPAVWAVGEMLGLGVATLAAGGDWEHFWDTTLMIVWLVILPLALCAGLGSLLGKWLHQRRQRATVGAR